MRPFRNHQLRGVTDQRVGKRSVNAALVVEIRPPQISLHLKRRHIIDPIGLLEDRRQALNPSRQGGVEAGDRWDTWVRQFVYPVDRYVTSPDNPRVDGPGILERSVLRHGYTALDSIIIKAIAQSQWGRVVVPPSAIAAINAVPVIDLVVYLDVELVIRSRPQSAVVVIIELVCVAGLRIEIEDRQSDGIQFAGRDHVQFAVGLHLLSVYTGIPTS